MCILDDVHEEIGNVYNSVSLSLNSEIEIIGPYNLTGPMSDALRDIRKRTGRATVVYRPYSSEFDLEGMLAPPKKGVRRIMLFATR